MATSVLFIQLVAHAALISRLLGPRGMGALYAGFALLMYGGAVSAGKDDARRALGWLGGPWRQWAIAAVAGILLGIAVSSTTLSVGHSMRVVEASHNEILAITLGPIIEEICLRGLLIPLIARAVGPAGAVITTSALFAILHWPASTLKLGSISFTGIVYGSIRVRSGSTAFAAVAHATYNMTVLIIAFWR